MQTGDKRECDVDDNCDSVISDLIAKCKQQRLPFQAALEDVKQRIASVMDRLKGDEMQLREEVSREREAHRAATANGSKLYKKLDKAEQALQRAQSELVRSRSACEVLKVDLSEVTRDLEDERELHQLTATERDEWRQQFAAEQLARDEAEQALKMARAALEETRLARGVIIAERDEAEQKLEDERKVHAETSSDRMRLIVDLHACQQQRDRLQEELEQLQRRIGLSELEIQPRRDEAGSKDAAAIEASCTCEDILTALKSAADALEYLAEIGDANECAYYSGFAAAIHVVAKFKGRTNCEKT